MVRLVDVFIDGWDVQNAMYPVDAVIGEDKEST